MAEDKNNRTKEPFIQEKIAGPNPKKKRRKVAFVLGLSVLAGILAAIAFSLTLWLLPRPDQPETEPVETPQETEPPETEPVETEPSTEQVTDDSQIESLVAQYLEEQVGLSLINEYVQDLYQKAAGSLIEVTVATEDTDWMNHTYEEEGIIQGVIVRVKAGRIYIMMNGADLDGATRHQVKIRENYRDAEIFAVDRLSDLWILTVDVKDLSAMELERYHPISFVRYAAANPGNFVMAVGNPIGTANSMDFGFVTYRGKSSDSVDLHYDVIYTDMPAYEDASGLFLDEKGQAVGWITDRYKAEQFGECLSAISSDSLTVILDGLLAQEPAGYLGVVGKDVTRAQEEQFGVPYGLYVTQVQTGSPAFDCGLQNGDVIVKCNIDTIYNMRTLQKLVLEAKAGDTWKLKVLRWSRDSYKEIELSVVLQGRP